MDNFLTTIKNIVNTIAEFLQKLFFWKKGDFEPASDAVSEYLSEKEAEKA